MWQTGLNPELIRRVEAFIADAARQGIRLQVVSALRTREQQVALYNRYKAGQSHLPAAKPGTSKHERGLAVDVGVIGKTSRQVPWATWQKIGAIGSAHGLKWLGAKDKPHFELPAGNTGGVRPAPNPAAPPSTPAPSGKSTPEKPSDDGGHLPAIVRDAAWYGGALIGGAALAQILIVGVVLVGGVWALNSLTRPSEN